MYDTLLELGAWLRSIHWGWLYVGMIGIIGWSLLAIVVSHYGSLYWPRWITIVCASIGASICLTAILYGYSLWITREPGTSVPKHRQFSGLPEVFLGIMAFLAWGRTFLQSVRRD